MGWHLRYQIIFPRALSQEEQNVFAKWCEETMLVAGYRVRPYDPEDWRGVLPEDQMPRWPASPPEPPGSELQFSGERQPSGERSLYRTLGKLKALHDELPFADIRLSDGYEFDNTSITKVDLTKLAKAAKPRRKAKPRSAPTSVDAEASHDEEAPLFDPADRDVKALLEKARADFERFRRGQKG